MKSELGRGDPCQPANQGNASLAAKPRSPTSVFCCILDVSFHISKASLTLEVEFLTMWAISILCLKSEYKGHLATQFVNEL